MNETNENENMWKYPPRMSLLERAFRIFVSIFLLIILVLILIGCATPDESGPVATSSGTTVPGNGVVELSDDQIFDILLDHQNCLSDAALFYIDIADYSDPLELAADYDDCSFTASARVPVDWVWAIWDHSRCVTAVIATFGAVSEDQFTSDVVDCTLDMWGYITGQPV